MIKRNQSFSFSSSPSPPSSFSSPSPSSPSPSSSWCYSCRSAFDLMVDYGWGSQLPVEGYDESKGFWEKKESLFLKHVESNLAKVYEKKSTLSILWHLINIFSWTSPTYLHIEINQLNGRSKLFSKYIFTFIWKC